MTHLTRRDFLAVLAATGLPYSGSSISSNARTRMGVGQYSFSHPKPALEFLEYCSSLGAGGVQTELNTLDAVYVKRLRQRAEELGMYLEGIVSLPRGDTDQFERAVRAAKDAGALCLRSACLDGRRYEDFSTLTEWKNFVSDSKARIARALPILQKHRVPLALENHKDWTVDELPALLKEYESEYLGVCLDTGNNIALLDDPMEVVERLAPYAVSTHIKDMALEEYAQGFLLVEVPLGEGLLDMKRIAGSIRRARPKTKFTLEMITRSPLKIPCLNEKYWETFAERSGRYLARTLALARSGNPNRPSRPLRQLDALDGATRARLEEDNVKKCLTYARDVLGLGWEQPESSR